MQHAPQLPQPSCIYLAAWEVMSISTPPKTKDEQTLHEVVTDTTGSGKGIVVVPRPIADDDDGHDIPEHKKPGPGKDV